MNTKTSVLCVAFLVTIAEVKSDFTADVTNSVKTLAGINCLVQTAFTVESAANDFTYDIEVCNVDVSDIISTIWDNCDDITSITGNIIDLNDGICKNAAYDESTDADTTPPSRCSNQMKTRLANLNTAIATAQSSLNSLNQIKDSCSRIAASDLKLNLKSFSDSVKLCASLDN